MKHLGVDFGKKRIGLATSDESGFFAFPHSVLKNDWQTIDGFLKILEEEKIEKIILGDSKNLDMKDNEIMEKVHSFEKILREKTQIEIKYFSEIYTSQEAARVAPKDHLHDARAAALILQGYLDNQNKK